MSDWPPELVEKVRSTLSKRDVFPIYDSFTEADARRLLDAIADDIVLRRDLRLDESGLSFDGLHAHKKRYVTSWEEQAPRPLGK